MQEQGRAILLGISAWVSVCLLIAGWLPNPSPEVHYLWMISGLVGLVSSVGLAEVIKTDILAQQSLLNEYIEASQTDGLTGVGNRQALDKALLDTFAHKDVEKSPLCLIMIDIDHFKSINDQWGHQAGDAVLKNLSAQAVKFFKGKGCTARYGGEEFAVALPRTKLKEAFVIAERFRKLVKFSTTEYNGQVIPISISAGIAETSAGDTPESLIHRADSALYTAKKKGRDRIWTAYSATQAVEFDELEVQCI